jgi:uncharacterized protein
LEALRFSQALRQLAGFASSKGLARWHKPRRRVSWGIACALLGVITFAAPAAADRLRTAARAFAAHDYAKAVEIFTALAGSGNAQAQTYLGYMFLHGDGVPQNFMVSAGWYRCAAQQGVARAQYQLGLMYDKGQGVPQDYVIAYSLLNLAVARAGPERERWTLIRDAVASKLSLVERIRGQQLAFQGPPGGECLPIVTGY